MAYSQSAVMHILCLSARGVGVGVGAGGGGLLTGDETDLMESPMWYLTCSPYKAVVEAAASRCVGVHFWCCRVNRSWSSLGIYQA